MPAPLHSLDSNLIFPLRALLQQRNVTRAAKGIGLSQSSMSHALARLREHFGDPLLVQHGRNMVLTELARSLIQPTDEAFIGLERVFLHRERFDPATSERVFKLATTDNIEFYLLPKLLGILAKEAPGIRLHVQPLSPDWIGQLQSGEVDLKLGRKYRLQPGLHSQDLLTERFTCVVAHEHPAAPRRLTLDEYAALRHLDIEPNPGAPAKLDAQLARHGLTRRVALVIPHFMVAPFIVVASDLALTASERLLTPFISTLPLRALTLPVKLDSYTLTQVWAERAQADTGHRWLRDAVARAAA